MNEVDLSLQTKQDIDIEREMRLFHASASGNAEEVKCWIALGVSVNALDYCGRSALHLGAERNHTELVEFLVSQRANMDVTDAFGDTPLSLAIKQKNTSVVSSLCKLGANLNPTSQGRVSKAELTMLKCFPVKVAEQLMSQTTVLPIQRDCVSVFFCELVEYDTFRADLPAPMLYQLLHRLRTTFDQLAAAHGVQTIDAFDGCYIAAANFLETQPHDHAVRLARFALAAAAAAAAIPIDSTRTNLGSALVRAGAHCGRVCGSILGTRGGVKYTLVGDAVNLASRMQSQGNPGAVQCSEAMAALIQSQMSAQGPARDGRERTAGGGGEGGKRRAVGGMGLTRREGKLDVKGLGQMSTYWLSSAGDAGATVGAEESSADVPLELSGGGDSDARRLSADTLRSCSSLSHC